MQALFGAIKDRKKGPSTSNNGDSPPPSDVKYSPGVHRLEIFLTHSKTILSFAGQDQDAAIRACKVCQTIMFFITMLFRWNLILVLILCFMCDHIMAGSGGILWRGRRRTFCRTTVASSPWLCFVYRKRSQEIRPTSRSRNEKGGQEKEGNLKENEGNRKGKRKRKQQQRRSRWESRRRPYATFFLKVIESVFHAASCWCHGQGEKSYS